jgi:hypothetical protein
MECKSLSLQDCEQQVVRAAVRDINRRVGKMNKTEYLMMKGVVEAFMKGHDCVCYGGSALNTLLAVPIYEDYQHPDFDLYTPFAMEYAKKLVDIFHKKGVMAYARSGIHEGTFKVYVDFLPLIDFTFMPNELYAIVKREAVVKKGLYYAHPDLLRQHMYLELSAPLGETARWEKVLHRLNLLNKHYPLVAKCSPDKYNPKFEEVFLQQNVVFIGGVAQSLYADALSAQPVLAGPDFDAISNNLPALRKKLKKAIPNVTFVDHKGVGTLVLPHMEVKVDGNTVAYVYPSQRCESYTKVPYKGTVIRVATIDTLLSYYLAFMYAEVGHYKRNKIMCLAAMLMKARLDETGLLKRFVPKCYGQVSTLQTIRKARYALRNKLSRKSAQYKTVFFNYDPTR